MVVKLIFLINDHSTHGISEEISFGSYSYPLKI